MKVNNFFFEKIYRIYYKKWKKSHPMIRMALFYVIGKGGWRVKQIPPVIWKETGKIAGITFVGVSLMWLCWMTGNRIWPEIVRLQDGIFPAGTLGGFIAVLNFFFLGINTQKVLEEPEEERARMRMQVNYHRRRLMLMLWVILTILVPFLHPVAGIAPLFFPTLGIKVLGIGKTKDAKGEWG